ncbi:hypothetical protein MUP32_01500 [Candidatus Microgenomates bacterium]|nr:hypothetical protein [Candidatus Microgenomates bacterium]
MTPRYETLDRPHNDDFPSIVLRLGLPSRANQRSTFGFPTISGLPDQEDRRIRQAWFMGKGTPITITDYGLVRTEKQPTLRTLELTFDGLDISVLTQIAKQAVTEKIKLINCFSLKPQIKGRLRIGFVNQGIVGARVERYKKGHYVEEKDLTALFNDPAYDFASKETFSFLVSLLQRMPPNGEVYNRRRTQGLGIDLYRDDPYRGGRKKNKGKIGDQRRSDVAGDERRNNPVLMERLKRRREKKKKVKRGPAFQITT